MPNLKITLKPYQTKYKVIVDAEGEPPPPSYFERTQLFLHQPLVEKEINDTIIHFLKHSEKVVHGAKAMNIQIPIQFRRPTQDWDIYSHHAFKDADKIEDMLDNIFHRDVFYVVSVPLSTAKGRKVYRVINRLTGKSVADFMTKKRMPPHIIVDAIRYASLLYLKKRQEAILRNKKAQYRWAKARADLNRINRAIEYMRMKLGR